MSRLQAFFRIAAFFALPVAITVQSARAQHGTGSPAGTSGTSGTGTPTPGTTGVGTNTNSGPYSNSSIYNTPTLTRPVFLSGRVVLDDGNKPSTDIAIQRVCYGNPHTETHTDSKGRFSFQFGSNQEPAMDASESSIGSGPVQPGTQGRSTNTANNTGVFGSRGGTTSYVQRCQIQASYPGYRSDVIDLYNRRSLDDPDLGVIVLHRLGGIQGTAISMTSESAPKKARKEYEKAQQLVAKGKVEEAQKQLQAAVAEYPKYAVAWYDLGRLQQSSHDVENAHKSYEAAIAADSKYVNPYDALAGMAAEQSKWQEAADRSKQAVDLNPVEFPSAWLYNAFANYNLKHYELAEKSAKEVVKLDGPHKYAQVETLLAQLCANRGDYAGAAQHLQTYLQLRPDAPNAEALKQQLAKLQATVAQMKK
ncbi:MAG: tetratricopeptide repeat protein [Bryobacteraceae bacterium]